MTSLTEVLRQYSEIKFSYGGISDCCAFAGAVVEAVHGFNPMDDFEYTNRKEAEDIIKKHGSLLAAVAAKLGKPLPVEGAEEGDVLIALQQDGSWIVGAVVGDRMAVKTSQGLTDWPLHFAAYRWRPSCRQ